MLKMTLTVFVLEGILFMKDFTNVMTVKLNDPNVCKTKPPNLSAGWRSTQVFSTSHDALARYLAGGTTIY